MKAKKLKKSPEIISTTKEIERLRQIFVVFLENMTYKFRILLSIYTDSLTDPNIFNIKVQILREGHNIWKNLPPYFDITYLVTKWEIFLFKFLWPFHNI